MRARASIPAWAKVSLAVAGVITVLALLTFPMWQSRYDECAALRENVDAVRTEVASQRVSDVWVQAHRLEKYGRRETMIVAEHGDFRGYLSRFTLRSCLGPEWTEGLSTRVETTWVDEAWYFRRDGWPTVVYLVGIDHGFKTQIRIEQQ
jgi:hypothetical protein